jgi:hypothetical protein
MSTFKVDGLRLLVKGQFDGDAVHGMPLGGAY